MKKTIYMILAFVPLIAYGQNNIGDFLPSENYNTKSEKVPKIVRPTFEELFPNSTLKVFPKWVQTRKSFVERELVWDFLKNDSTNAEEIIALLSKNDKTVAELYGQSVGVSEFATLREHTLAVYQQCKEQIPFYREALEEVKGVDALHLMKFIIVLSKFMPNNSFLWRNK